MIRLATLTLALSLDESGNVRRVEVLKSSGSRNLDQAWNLKLARRPPSQ